MPNFSRNAPCADAQDDLEVVSRVMGTVARQVASYQLSLEKLRGLRKEIKIDAALEKRIKSSPETMKKLLVERGIPEALAIGMAAEDFQDANFMPSLALWTWDCCCSGCCLTCICTNNTSAYQNPGAINEQRG
ncbi:hypothetical protein BH11PSE10_BH11PSE10_08710 [soil metagenome]